MRKAKPARKSHPRDRAALDELIEQITVDANGDDEQFGAFLQAFEDDVPVPGNAYVIGEPVSLVRFDYDGNIRRGLTATCRRPDGREYTVAASDVVFPHGTEGASHVAAYRKWMGLAPFSVEPSASAPQAHSETSDLILPAKGVAELAVLSVDGQTARCRFVRRDGVVSLRGRRHWVPGEIVRVKLRRKWNPGDPDLFAAIESGRIDAPALGLTPLRLQDCGVWDPTHEFWGDPIGRWAKPIIARGPRLAFEMEQVLPGYDFSDPERDPIGIAVDLKDSGDAAGAYKVLMNLCEADLRCLDAHAHLGNLAFGRTHRDAAKAIRHYEAGFRIGELSLADGFDGVLSWRHVDNRPFLRCMHGYGLCLWRLRQFAEAREIFDRMLWLSPSDNQGVRFLIDDVRAKRAWEDRPDY